MRRFRPLMALLTVLFLILALAPAAAAEEKMNLNAADLMKVSVTIDGVALNADAFIVAERTMVPLRAIFEALGATIEWNAETWTVTATKASKIIKLTVGEMTAYVDGKPETLAVAPVLINSRTFVPLRFISQALGSEIAWDQPTLTAQIKTGASGCTLAPFQKHEGTITKGGETWGRCGSPHLVTGTFRVEGADSPILSIEAGTIIQFEQDAQIEVGRNAPGGMKVYGTATDPAVFTAATSGPQPGFWSGLRFYNQTLVNDTIIDGARIEYAGESEYGALLIEGHEKTVEIVLKNVEFKQSQFAGLHMTYQGRLKAGSTNLKVSDTVQGNGAGGFPIVTATFGSHNLPRGEFKNNAVNAVNINEHGQGHGTVAANTTWRNVSIPYAISQNIYVEGSTSPTLTIEPGVITLWDSEAALYVGKGAAGHLVADAVAKPEGGGEWYTRPEGGGEWRVGKAELDLGVQLANAGALEPGCALCGKNRAIVFGAWNGAPERGAWQGIYLKDKAGDKSRLNGVVIAWGGKDSDYYAGLYAETNEGTTVKLTLSNSMIYGAARSGLELYGNAQLKPESTGNYFLNNGWPVRMPPNAVGFLPVGQTFAENTKQVVSVWAPGSSDVLTKTATWKNHGVPYLMELSVFVGGTASPVLTIEAGTVLSFTTGNNLTVGQDGTGSLVAAGKAGQPVKFTAEAERAGAWEGISFGAEAGKGNRLEYVTIEYANVGVSLNVDLGGFIKNTTIRSSADTGIYRGYDLTGTSFMTGLGNQFEGNATDENQ
ncbi:MAG TPA: copper amine oxidase N-terminal domain-containing protein [Symbiobacteriaceae bacterium]|nr:copper amine oxidase N-terminal domain-containing protein [Symbiobacteriaceae bacterium]